VGQAEEDAKVGVVRFPGQMMELDERPARALQDGQVGLAAQGAGLGFWTEAETTHLTPDLLAQLVAHGPLS
jgi:hypothetical protein